MNEQRIIENSKVFDFELSEKDCDAIAAIDFRELGITPQRNPDENNF